MGAPDHGGSSGAEPSPADCVVVGGGPAGLTAAIYMARFRLDVRVFDAGAGRAASIPCTRNHAGFPEGVSGAELLARMWTQAERFGARIKSARVEGVEFGPAGFRLSVGGEALSAKTVLLATGVTNRRPPMSEALHREALARGAIRYCPVCDGYEVTDRTVAVIGTGEHGMRETEFLRAYTGRLTLIAPDGPHDLTDAQRRRLANLGVALIEGPARGFSLTAAGMIVETGQGALAFDSVYPAMGSDVHSDLARDLGARLTDLGCIVVDTHQRTSVPGLYAAGDVVVGLDQISHAMGEAGVAATTIRNDLADQTRAAACEGAPVRTTSASRARG